MFFKITIAQLYSNDGKITNQSRKTSAVFVTFKWTVYIVRELFKPLSSSPKGGGGVGVRWQCRKGDSQKGTS